MKPYLIWSDDYKIGIRKIDRQHKKIFKIYNSIIDNYYYKSSCKVLIKDLVDYGYYHLETEEEFFRVLGYEGIASHKEDHNAFILEISELQKREENEGLLEKDLVYLLQWLKKHVLVTDTQAFKVLFDKYKKLSYFQKICLNY